MVKHAGLLVCDSKNIEAYIQKEYARYHPKTTFIAYGAQTEPSSLASDDERLLEWYHEQGVQEGGYYLVVGRFVPENNYETMLREYSKSHTHRPFVLITDVSDGFWKNSGKKPDLTRTTGYVLPGRSMTKSC